MPLDPFIESILPTFTPMPAQIEDWPALRAEASRGSNAMIEQLVEPGPDVADVRTVSIPVTGGSIDLIVYTPASPGPHPAHLFLHGGGFVAGTAHDDYIDIVSRERCVGASCVVVAVDYRKAPEHKFPTALNDAQAALEWVVANADELGVRTNLITAGGQSAGGNLAAALALKLRDEHGPQLAFVLLEVPALDFTLSLPSHQTYGTGYALHLVDVQRIADWYLSSPDTEAHNPYVSPLLAEDLAGLPPTYIMSAEFDMLRDDGQLYAQRLQEAGVPVTFSLQLGHVHSSAAMTKVMASARAWRDEVIDVLGRAHRGENAIAALGQQQ